MLCLDFAHCQAKKKQSQRITQTLIKWKLISISPHLGLLINADTSCLYRLLIKNVSTLVTCRLWSIDVQSPPAMQRSLGAIRGQDGPSCSPKWTSGSLSEPLHSFVQCVRCVGEIWPFAGVADQFQLFHGNVSSYIVWTEYNLSLYTIQTYLITLGVNFSKSSLHLLP